MQIRMNFKERKKIDCTNITNRDCYITHQIVMSHYSQYFFLLEFQISPGIQSRDENDDSEFELDVPM